MNLLVSEAEKKQGKLIDLPRTFRSPEDVKLFYDKHGYVTLKAYIPSEYLDDVVRDLGAIFEPYSSESENPIDSGIIELDKNNQKRLYELHNAANKSTAFKFLSRFLSDVVRNISGITSPTLEIASGLLLSIPKDDRLVYDFHQESSYMKEFDDIFNIHYPLLRTSTIENGTMSILPGTHKLGVLEYEASRKSENSYTDLRPKRIEEIEATCAEFHCYLELGDVIIFHKDLIHKSNYNASTLCRPVGIQRLTQSISGDWVHRSPEELL